MSATTVSDFASELRKSPDSLLEQLRLAGVEKNGPDAPLSEADKYALLRFLKASHGLLDPARKKITLVKKSGEKAPASAYQMAELQHAHERLAEIQRQLLNRCIEVSVRGRQRTLLIQEGNGDLTPIDASGDNLSFDARRKIQLIGSYFATALSILASRERVGPIETLPRELNKVLGSYLRTMADRAVPDSQRGLCSNSARTRQANLIGAANDLVRFEHVFPACAATISLA
jgi:hypothetical protein